ncbi:hypothetical protein A9P82_09070 [Arachidicoccus ginsenosidimutans]|uniref:hypothetical protein n=1 Tax=Arachidicoccus sp. BS20 TaxID=1850526 RepID=UPI0007F129A8|nr:hypothetical protein [Arachidicoccus sp. BS20]ANI89432.1 hypothetical protein A9P82_09070 [Arachidicoccus sp. BS20]
MENSPLQSLEDKLQKLLQRFEQLRKDNQKLRNELDKTQTSLAQANKKIEEIQRQNDALKIGVQHWSPEEKKRLQARIDGYLKDIEKCLSLLDA